MSLYCNPAHGVHSSVPQHVADLMVCWCERCGQYRLYATVHVNGDDDPAPALYSFEYEFGPFDGWSDVLELIRPILEERMRLPAVPGY